MARWASWLAAASVVGSCASFAAPIQYTLTFDGSLGSGPNGTGTFTYDSATQQGNGLAWNFGGGEVGGVLDSAFTGNGNAEFLFELILVNLTKDPNAYGASFSAGLPATYGPFGEDLAQFCWGTLSSTCGMDNPGVAMASYRIYDQQGDGGPAYRGYLTVEAIGVPEPSALALVLAAALAAGIVPAWARRAATSARRRPHSS